MSWEDSPEGYPRSAPCDWWNWHDNYHRPDQTQGAYFAAEVTATDLPG